MRERVRHLSPAELETAIQHAVSTHHLEEQERERLREATDLDTLRAILRDVGLPAEDVEKALRTLPQALRRKELDGEKREEKRDVQRWMAAAVAGVVVSLALVVVAVANSGHDANLEGVPAKRAVERARPLPPPPPVEHTVVVPVVVPVEPVKTAPVPARPAPAGVKHVFRGVDVARVAEGVLGAGFTVTRAECVSQGNIGQLLSDDDDAKLYSVRAKLTAGRGGISSSEEVATTDPDEANACRLATTDAARRISDRFAAAK